MKWTNVRTYVMVFLMIALIGLTACSSKEKYFEVTLTPVNSFNVSSKELEATVTVLKNRLDSMNIMNREISIDDADYSINIRFGLPSGIKDEKDIVTKLCIMSKLTFKNQDGKILLDGRDVKEAKEAKNKTDQNFSINLKLTDEGTIKFSKATKDNIGKIITISIDDVVLMSPTVATEINDGSVVITGNYKVAYAKSLAEQINAGVLPYAIKAGSTIQIDTIDGSEKKASSKSTDLNIIGMWKDTDGTIRIFDDSGTCNNVATIDIGGPKPTYSLSQKQDSNGYYLLYVEQSGYNQTTFYVKADSNDSIKIYEKELSDKPLYILTRQ